MNWISVFTFLKKYWFVGLLAAGLVYHFIQMNRMEDLMNIANESHSAQITALKDFHAKEIKGREKIIEEHENRVKAIDKKYRMAKWALAKERKNRIDQIQKESPEQIAKRIEDAYGFTRIP